MERRDDAPSSSSSNGNGNGNGSGYFNKGRLRGALLLLGSAVGLMVWDAVSPDYQLDTGQLALMLATSLGLLGVEAFKGLPSIFGGPK